MRRVRLRSWWWASAVSALLAACVMKPVPAPGETKDPGVRGGPPGAGEILIAADKYQRTAFDLGLEVFSDTNDPQDGLGPRMNLDSCAGCHAAPVVGGTSPEVNPQVAFATLEGARNKLPSFIRPDGPALEVRRVRNPDGSPDGGVHSLFSIAGRKDAPDCNAAQEDFEVDLARRNLAFRIPTPLFGAGMIEMIPDREILANLSRDRAEKDALGIKGRPNRNQNGKDGAVGRFGWKAQHSSLLVLAGEFYNVQMGVTNDVSPTEREEDPACQFTKQPNDVRNLSRGAKGMDGKEATLSVEDVLEASSLIERAGFFMRLLAPPMPVRDKPGGIESIERGRATFNKSGCVLCHVTMMTTGDTVVNAYSRERVYPYSDLLLHDMGEGLADGISQGQAGPRDFRTAPLWGLGQRRFFLHDGRTSDLREAVQAHFSRGSEANEVIRRFYGFSVSEQQDLYNFLRSL